MGTIKKILFTNKKTNETKQINVGEIGENVFKVTNDTSLMNMAIRSLTKYDSCEHELFDIKVVREEV